MARHDCSRAALAGPACRDALRRSDGGGRRVVASPFQIREARSFPTAPYRRTFPRLVGARRSHALEEARGV